MIRIYIWIITLSCLVSGCVSSLLSTAQLAYDRHNIHQQVSNQQLAVRANHALFDKYPALKRQNISIVAYNKDLIVLGQVSNKQQKQLVSDTLQTLKGARRFFNELTIGSHTSFSQSLADSWITSKIRATMIATNDLDPSPFKIITEKGVVYVLGDVKKTQANIVVDIARKTDGVQKVVRVLRYYKYVSQKLNTGR